MDTDEEVAHVNLDDRPLILRAAYASDLHALRRAIADGADVNVANEDGFTALDFLLNWGDEDNRFACIEALVEAGADVNRLVGTRFDEDEDEGEDVSTPLLDALFSFRDQPAKCQAVTTLLLRAGADVRRSTPRGMTPLHIAAMWGLTYIIPTLLAAGAEVNAVFNHMGFRRETPLVSAIRFVNDHREDRKRVFAKLLRAGARLPTNVHNCPPYLISVWANGGFARYERIHRTRLAAIFLPKFPRLPAEIVHHIVSIWADCGGH